MCICLVIIRKKTPIERLRIFLLFELSHLTNAKLKCIIFIYKRHIERNCHKNEAI